jgi:predicted PurR-regulated permease PerM
MDDTSLFDYYLAIRTEKERVMEAHSRHVRHYVTLVTAIQAVALGAVYQFRDDARLALMAATLGFVVNIVMCRVAILACNRAYQMFLELVTIAIKLEASLGLHGPRPTTTVRERKPKLFPDDKHLLPDRWRHSAQHKTAAEFVRDNMDRGINHVVRVTMSIMAAMNAALWVGVLVILLSPTESAFAPHSCYHLLTSPLLR